MFFSEDFDGEDGSAQLLFVGISEKQDPDKKKAEFT